MARSRSVARRHTCSGVAAPATPAPTPVTAESMDCINGRKLYLKTCATKSAFQDIGCTCFTCNEVNGHITLACTAPFACSNEFNGENYVAEEEAPKLKTKDYAIICVVYAGVAGALVAVAWVTSPKKRPDGTKQSMCAKAAAFCNPAKLASLAIQKGNDFFNSYFIEPNKRSDGQPTTFSEFWASENIWVALLSQTCGCGCARPRQPPPNYKPPMIMSRAFGELMAGTFTMFSLAFLVGTVVNNSEGCSTVIHGNICQQGGVTQSFDTTSSTSNGQCQSVDVDKTTGAAVLTTVLTKVVNIAGSYAEDLAEGDAKRKSMLLGGRILATLALLGFGVGYTYAIASSTGGNEMANRRYATIGTVLGPSWAADQVTDMFGVLAQRLGIFFVWYGQMLEVLVRILLSSSP